MPQSQRILFAHSIEDAADQLAADPELSILAGATWMMRAGLRREQPALRHLALSRVAALHEIALGEEEVSIGAMATHARIAHELARHPELAGLCQAAQNSANPGVRRLATVGGNICAKAFAAADLVPALLALNADVEVISAGTAKRLPLTEFIDQMRDNTFGFLSRVIIARKPGVAAHARLTMRAAGDYPVAIASIWRSSDQNEVRVAIGSVEASARRWNALEAALNGSDTDAAGAERMAKALLYTIAGRDAVDAKGSYRVRVLPSLIGQAFGEIDRAISEVS